MPLRAFTNLAACYGCAVPCGTSSLVFLTRHFHAGLSYAAASRLLRLQNPEGNPVGRSFNFGDSWCCTSIPHAKEMEGVMSLLSRTGMSAPHAPMPLASSADSCIQR